MSHVPDDVIAFAKCHAHEYHQRDDYKELLDLVINDHINWWNSSQGDFLQKTAGLHGMDGKSHICSQNKDVSRTMQAECNRRTNNPVYTVCVWYPHLYKSLVYMFIGTVVQNDL